MLLSGLVIFAMLDENFPSHLVFPTKCLRRYSFHIDNSLYLLWICRDTIAVNLMTKKFDCFFTKLTLHLLSVIPGDEILFRVASNL